MRRLFYSKWRVMKHFSLLLVVIFAIPQISNAMEPQEELSAIEHVPNEIRAQILLNIIEGDDTPSQTIKNILNFTQTNKSFATVLNDEYINKLLIQKLAAKYYNNNQLKAAQELNTLGARKWITSYLSQGKRQKQEAIAPLFAALYGKDNKAVINLINAGLDANTRDKKLGKTPLMVAAQNGDLPLMDFLLSKGAAIDSSDKQGNTPLIYAIRSGKIDAVKLLLDKGALIDAQNSAGFTPLMWALHKKQPEIAKLLLNKNADISLTDKQRATALMESAQHDLPEMAQLLIAKGADVNATTSEGDSALLDAVEESPEVTQILLNAGANPLQINHFGFNALMLGAKNPEILKLLLNTPARSLINGQDSLGFTH